MKLTTNFGFHREWILGPDEEECVQWGCMHCGDQEGYSEDEELLPDGWALLSVQEGCVTRYYFFCQEWCALECLKENEEVNRA